MDKKIKVAALLFAMLCSVFAESYSQSTDCNVTVQFTTVSAGGFFAPNHVLAVWVETTGGQFVRSLKVLAIDHKENLYTWLEASSDNIIDAITGATKTEHSAEAVVWNGKDVDHIVVPDGDYKVIVEFTEEHVQGPLLEIPFTKNTTPSDSTFTNATNYTNISIDYALNSINAIDDNTTSKASLSVYPNPFTNQATIKIWSDKSTNARLSIYSINGQNILNLGALILNNGENFIELNNEDIGKIPIGTYLLRLEYDNEIRITKLVKH